MPVRAWLIGPMPTTAALRGRGTPRPGSSRGLLTTDGRAAQSPGMAPTRTAGAASFRQGGPCLAAEAEGIDLTQPLSPEAVGAVPAGKDQSPGAGVPDQPGPHRDQRPCARTRG